MRGGKRGARYELGAAAHAHAPFPDRPSRSASPELPNNPPEFGVKPPEWESGSGDVWSELDRIAEPARAHPYLDATTRDAVVVRLCSVAALSLRELARLPGRNVDHTRTIVTVLIEAGRLARRYPDQPNHPRQKYIAAGIIDSPAEGAPPP